MRPRHLFAAALLALGMAPAAQAAPALDPTIVDEMPDWAMSEAWEQRGPDAYRLSGSDPRGRVLRRRADTSRVVSALEAKPGYGQNGDPSRTFWHSRDRTVTIVDLSFGDLGGAGGIYGEIHDLGDQRAKGICLLARVLTYMSAPSTSREIATASHI